MKHKKKKDKSNPRANTIEEIEQVFWGDTSSDDTHLIETCHRLRRKDLDTFSIEDYRILIGQSIALELLIPPALKILETNIAAKGDLYEGDLLSSVLRSEKVFWKNHFDMKQAIIKMVMDNMQDLVEREIMDRQMKRAFEEFKNE